MADPKQQAAELVEKAQLLERGGDDEAALAIYLDALAIDPANRTLFTSLERVSYRRERWDSAMLLYDRAIQLVESGQSRAYRLSDLYLRKGHLQLQFLHLTEEAIASYQHAVELDPEVETAQAMLEEIYSARGNWPELIASYERRAALVHEDSKRVEMLSRAARLARIKLADDAKATRLYELILATDPTNLAALDVLEYNYEQQHSWTKLAEVLRSRVIFTTGGDEAMALFRRIASLCEDNLHHPAEAIDAYQKILAIAPANHEALAALARLYECTARWGEFIEITKRQIRITSDHAHKALLYFKCGSVMEAKFANDAEAIDYYSASIKTSQTCLPAIHGLRDLYVRRADWPRVIETLKFEANIWSDIKERAGVLAHMGQIYDEKLSDRDCAIRHYQAALKADPECVPASRALFEHHFTVGDHAQAAALAKIVTQKGMREGDPQARSEFQRKRAVAALAGADLAGAVEALLASLEHDPQNLAALELLIEVTRQHSMTPEYISAFRELEKIYRRGNAGRALARVLIALAYLREQDCDIDGAEQLYQESIQLAPGDFLVIEALVGFYLRLRRLAAAAQVLDRFIEQAQPSERARGRMLLATLYGDWMMEPERAAQVLREIITEDPSYSELKRMREGAEFAARALELYGTEREGASLCDRVALAELHARAPNGLAEAKRELLQLIEGDLHAAAGLLLLAQIYHRSGEPQRAARVASVIHLLGYGDPAAAPTAPPAPLRQRRPLSDELRRRWLLPVGLESVFLQALSALRQPLGALFPPPQIGAISPVTDPMLKSCIADVQQLMGVTLDVGMTRDVPRGAMVVEFERPLLIVDESLIEYSAPACRFFLGRALESLRGGYALPLRLPGAAQAELGNLLEDLLQPAALRNSYTKEIIGHFPRKAARAVEHWASKRAGQAGDVRAWLNCLETASHRAGLLASDDISAPIHMLALLGGDELAMTPSGEAVIGQIPGGPALVRFFLSDAYHELEQATRGT